MKIIQDDIELNFTDIHLSKFEISFFSKAEKLSKMIELDFSSMQQLKGNKEILCLAFDAELKENI
jgi:hypothetical protein